MSDLFDEKSIDWDTNKNVKNISSAVGETLLKHVSLNSQMVVMDFGAGTGLICSQVAPFVKQVVAVDISNAMLDKLKAKLELKDKVHTLCQDILEKPIGTKFDLIISAMAIHHVKDTRKLVQRFSEHLKPGAMIALADLDKEDGTFHPENTEGIFHFGFQREEFQHILEEQGFEDIQFFTPYHVNKNDKRYPLFLVIAKKPL